MIFGETAGCKVFRGVLHDSTNEEIIAIRALKTVGDLPETILEHEVLGRLQAQHFLRCKAISKEFWARLNGICESNKKTRDWIDFATFLQVPDREDWEFIILDTDGDMIFQKGVGILSAINHPNVLKLTGICTNGRLLIYDFPTMGSLDDLIHGKGGPCMNWTLRLQIALGIAHGLTYIHELEIPLISVGLRSSNVLLYENFVPKISNIFLVGLNQPDHMAGHGLVIERMLNLLISLDLVVFFWNCLQELGQLILVFQSTI